MGFALDASFLVDLSRRDPDAVRTAQRIDATGHVAGVPTPALYELLVGMLHEGSRTRASQVRAALESFPLLPFDEQAAERAAAVRSEMLRLGRPKSHVDTMIAGIALATGNTLVTRDRDFAEIAQAVELKVELY